MSGARRLALSLLGSALAVSLIAMPAMGDTRVEVSTTAFLLMSLPNGLTFTAGSTSIICDVTLHLTVRRLIAKIRDTLWGEVTAVLTANVRSSIGSMPSCAGLTPMFWQYERVGGTLPTITEVSLLLFWRWLIRLLAPGLFQCLYFESVQLTGANPVERLRIVPRLIIEPRPLGASEPCPPRATVTGEFRLSPTMTVRLLEG
jgi:hypothetical protein